MDPYYSHPWAVDVFLEFKQIYQPEVELLKRLYNLSDHEIVRWLQCDQRKWNAFKKCTKYLRQSYKILEDDWNSLSPRRANYLTFDKYLKRMLQNVRSMGEFAIDTMMQRVLF